LQKSFYYLFQEITPCLAAAAAPGGATFRVEETRFRAWKWRQNALRHFDMDIIFLPAIPPVSPIGMHLAMRPSCEFTAWNRDASFRHLITTVAAPR
jgi:hypothetical protein